MKRWLLERDLPVRLVIEADTQEEAEADADARWQAAWQALNEVSFGDEAMLDDNNRGEDEPRLMEAEIGDWYDDDVVVSEKAGAVVDAH